MKTAGDTCVHVNAATFRRRKPACTARLQAEKLKPAAHTAAHMGEVLVSSRGDCALLQQLLYGALATELQELEQTGRSSQFVKAELERLTARVATLLALCVKKAERPCQGPGITEEQQAKPQEYDERDTLALEAEASAARQRIVQLRKDVPKQLTETVFKCMELSRPVPAHADLPDPEATATAMEGLSPKPGNLQALLSKAADRTPALRAKLAEALDRLGRVVTALEEEKDRLPHNAMERVLLDQTALHEAPAQPTMAEEDMFRKQLARILHDEQNLLL